MLWAMKTTIHLRQHLNYLTFQKQTKTNRTVGTFQTAFKLHLSHAKANQELLETTEIRQKVWTAFETQFIFKFKPKVYLMIIKIWQQVPVRLGTLLVSKISLKLKYIL